MEQKYGNEPFITSSNKYVEYGYDAAGIKISKKVYDGSTTKTINYIGAFEFDENNALTHFAMPEGRVRKSGSSTYTFEYFITDHQGNVRVSFEDNGSSVAVVRQENSYYPYGMIIAGNYQPSAPNKRLYNAGSEWQDEFSGTIDYFSTFFREYDPVLGRFNSVDPRAEITVDLSIYHYAGNNPINFNDPMGDLSQTELDGIIKRLSNNKFGGTWRADAPDVLFLFGDNETADFFASLIANIGAGGGSSLEDKVRGEILLGKAAKGVSKNYKNFYNKARDLIINEFPGVFKGNPSFRWFEDYGMVNENRFSTGPNPGESNDGTTDVYIYLSMHVLDKFALETPEDDGDLYWTFGQVTRAIYHEYVHFYQRYGLYDFEGNALIGAKTKNEREFTAYYLAQNKFELPYPGYNSKRMDYYSAINDNYNLLSQEKRIQYAPWVVKMVVFLKYPWIKGPK